MDSIEEAKEEAPPLETTETPEGTSEEQAKAGQGQVEELTWRCPATFVFFDSNGKCALSVWNERLKSLKGKPTPALQHLAEEREIRNSSSLEREDLVGELMSMEQLGELAYKAEPTWDDLQDDLEREFGTELCFEYAVRDRAGMHPCQVVDEASFRLFTAWLKRHGPMASLSLCPLPLELLQHPRRARMLHLGCFDADAGGINDWLGLVEVKETASWLDFVGVIRGSYSERMSFNGTSLACSLAYLKPLKPGKWRERKGVVKQVFQGGQGWPELLQACCAEPDRTLQADIHFGCNAMHWTVKDLPADQAVSRALLLPDALQEGIVVGLSSDSPHVTPHHPSLKISPRAGPPTLVHVDFSPPPQAAPGGGSEWSVTSVQAIICISLAAHGQRSLQPPPPASLPGHVPSQVEPRASSAPGHGTVSRVSSSPGSSQLRLTSDTPLFICITASWA